MPGKTTRGFRPGPIRPGRWFAELGLAAIAGRALGDADDRVAWRVEVEYSSDPAFADRPYRKTRYQHQAEAQEGRLVHGRPARPRRALGARRRDDARDVRLRVRQGQARLHHAHRLRHGLRLGRDRALQDRAATWSRARRRSSPTAGTRTTRSPAATSTTAPARSTTSRADGGVTLRRAAQPASRILRDVRRAGGFTQINHPTIFPSSNPLFALAVPRLPVGLLRAGDELRAGRRDRGQHRPAEDRRGAEPVHHDRDRLLRDGARRRRARRGAGRQRLPQRGPHDQRDPVARRRRRDRGLREGSSPSAGSSAPSRPATPTRRSAASPARRCASRARCRARASRRSSATPRAGAA